MAFIEEEIDLSIADYEQAVLNAAKGTNKTYTQAEIDALDPAVFGVGSLERDDGALFWSDGVAIQPRHDKDAIYNHSDVFMQTAETHQFSLATLSSNVLYGGKLNAGNSSAEDVIEGTKLSWDANQSLVDGDYIAVKAFPVWDLSSADNMLFEFQFPANHVNTRLQIILSGSTTSLANTSRLVWEGTKKQAHHALLLKKSDFSIFTGAGVDFSDIKRIDFRFTKAASFNGNQPSSITLKRIGIGGYTKPLVVISSDDIASEMYDIFTQVLRDRNIKGTHFVTDYELPLSDTNAPATYGKMTIEQLEDFAGHGWDYCAHNMHHAPYCFGVNSYSRTVDTLTINVNHGAVDVANIGGIDINDTITVEDSPVLELNKQWTVTAVTVNANDTDISIDVTGVPAFTDWASADGSTVTLDKYDVVSDIKLLQAIIKNCGLPTNDSLLSYTFGDTSKSIRQRLRLAGITLARSTLGAWNNGEYTNALNVVQLRRNYGLDGRSEKLLAIPTIKITTKAAIETNVNRLLSVGGLLSIYTHGDDNDSSIPDVVETFNYLADLRDANQIDLITFSELGEKIKQRKRVHAL